MNEERARNFIYRNARPLDLYRWRYLFEGGSREDVLNALSAYQNADGGFGHALEPDCWNPHSAPMQTWVATRILEEVGLEDPRHPIVQGILRYLSSGQDFDGHTWANTLPSNADYPHAPWWAPEAGSETAYNPTASLAGFALRFAEKGGALHGTARRVAQEAYLYLKEHFPLPSMHTASCFVELYEALRAGGVEDLLDLKAFEGLLREQIRGLITYDASKWATEYVCRPSQFVRSRESAFFAENREVCEKECRFLSASQEADGSWRITWAWAAYPEAWSVSKIWWKADQIIQNVRFARAILG